MSTRTLVEGLRSDAASGDLPRSEVAGEADDALRDLAKLRGATNG